MADDDKDKDDKPGKKVPPFILFKGPKLIELGYQETIDEYGLDCLDLKIYLGDGDNGGEEGKWYIDLVNTETGEVVGHYNYSHCPDPLNPDCSPG